MLFVAMADSLHTARWIDQLHGAGFDVHLFPTWDGGPVHAGLGGGDTAQQFPSG